MFFLALSICYKAGLSQTISHSSVCSNGNPYKLLVKNLLNHFKRERLLYLKVPTFFFCVLSVYVLYFPHPSFFRKCRDVHNVKWRSYLLIINLKHDSIYWSHLRLKADLSSLRSLYLVRLNSNRSKTLILASHLLFILYFASLIPEGILYNVILYSQKLEHTTKS